MVVDEDTIGELLIAVYLEIGVTPERAAKAAAGWGGDRYVLLSGPNDAIALASLIAWDTEDDAADFYQTFLHHMASLTGSQWKTSDREGTQQMVLLNRTVLLRLDGDRTLLIVAPDAALATAAAGEF